MADCVDLVGNVRRQRKNRIQASRVLNQCCAPDSRLESILFTSPRQNVYQHYLPKADIATLLSTIAPMAPKTTLPPFASLAYDMS